MTGRRAIACTLALVLGATLAVGVGTIAPSAAQSPTPEPRWLELDSDPGDSVGLGQDRTFGSEDADFVVNTWGRQLDVDVGSTESWDLLFEAPSSRPVLARGRYEAVSRWDRGPDDAVLQVTTPGRGCGPVSGWFEVDDIAWTDGRISRFSIRFEQRCEGDTGSLRGEVRWDGSAAPPTHHIPPGPIPTDLWQPPVGRLTAEENGGLLAYPGIGPDGSDIAVGEASPATYLDTPAGLRVQITFPLPPDSPIGTITSNLDFEWSTRQPTVLPGLYHDLPPRGANPVRGGFSVFPGPGCLDGTMDVAIDELDPGQDGWMLEDLSLRWVERCPSGGAPSRGALRTQAYRPAGTPGVPTGVTAEAGADSATVAWTPPVVSGDGPLTGYEITTYVDGLAVDEPTVVGPDATSTVVDDLDPGHIHTFKVAAVNAVGAGRRSLASSGAMVPGPDLGPFATVEELVDQQHVDFLGRRATPVERAALADSLRRGTSTSQELVRTLQARPEWQSPRALVTRLYQAYFLRPPDTVGLDHWVARLRAGSSTRWVSSSFAGSPEFRQRYGALGDGAFVDRVYENVLGRRADASGRAYWIDRLRSDAGRGTVMLLFSESAEHRARTRTMVDVVLTYTGMLRRAPTSAEVTGGGRGRSLQADVVRTLLASAEYAQRVR